MPIARVTQTPINVVYHSGVQPAMVTQTPVNIVYESGAPGRVTQTPVSVIFPIDPLPVRMLLPVRPVTETWEWKTGMFKSLFGDEQRMALRSEPFLKVNYQVPIKNEDDRIALRYAFHRFTGARVQYPLFQYSALITALASAGSSFLAFDPTTTNVRDNEPIAVFNDDLTSYQLLETSSVTPTGINLAANLEADIPAGYYIAPAPLSRFSDGQQFTMDELHGVANIQLTIVPPRTLLRPDEAASVTYYDGLPILPDFYLTNEAVPEQFMRNLNTMDTFLQDPNDEITWLNPQLLSKRSYVLTASELDIWRKFAATIRGSQKAFIIPSYRRDFELSAVPVLGASVLQTEDTFVHDYMQYEANRYLLIETANGSVYRKVTDVRLNMDRTADIYLDEALGLSAGDNIISKIGMMHKVRLAGDAVTLVHHIHHIQLSFGVAGVNE